MNTKLKNKYLTFDFVDYTKQNKFPLITNYIPNYGYEYFTIIGDSENFPLNLRIDSPEIRKLINSKYFLNLP